MLLIAKLATNVMDQVHRQHVVRQTEKPPILLQVPVNVVSVFQGTSVQIQLIHPLNAQMDTTIISMDKLHANCVQQGTSVTPQLMPSLSSQNHAQQDSSQLLKDPHHVKFAQKDTSVTRPQLSSV